ncbi:DUF2163 domain-containing protein [Ascidiaceihabitans sp.]|uniref:DUF2163 domain-containing protein n=1 Tax=Ascidiaceihabitans sp. TaxID=1872644 RepID=UPI00329977A4
MSDRREAFLAHVGTGLTTLCRCWRITRTDGVKYGFTDHDQNLRFGGVDFRAETGLSASALATSTGLSVDNTEALGALTDAAVREDDIEAGRFDGAEVRSWLVNWADVDQRWMQFRGTIGEMRRAGGAFQAELRGLTEALNRPLGRVYQKPCTAVLGDGTCRFDLSQSGFFTDKTVSDIEGNRIFRWVDFGTFNDAWFQRGRLNVQSGAAVGLWGAIKHDRLQDGIREIELWQPIRAPILPTDEVRLLAGCDKLLSTCSEKFSNIVNFQGFPDLPGEDWLLSQPKSSNPNTGGSRR